MTRTNKGVTKSNRFVWFKLWVLGKRTLDQLSQESGYSKRSLQSFFHEQLESFPTWDIQLVEPLNLLVDGTYFSKKICLVLYRDNNIKFTQLYRITDGEWFEEIQEDLKNLKALGLKIESITCDGHPSILKAIKRVDKSIIVQRCIIHIQRMCKIWLTLRPQSEAGQALRDLINNIHTIKDRTQWGYWVVDLIRWHEKYKNFVNEKTINPTTGRAWYKHRMVRKAFITIKRALPDMFHYLDNHKIPKSTNGLESFFGHLKDNLSIHRGLTESHRKNFIKWYLFFRNKEVKGFS